MGWLGRIFNTITGVPAFEERGEAIPGHAAIGSGPVPSGRFAIPGHSGGDKVFEAIPQSGLIRGKRLRVLYGDPDLDEEWVEGIATMIMRSVVAPRIYLSIQELGHKGPRHLPMEGIREIRDLRSGGHYSSLESFAHAHSIRLAVAEPAG